MEWNDNLESMLRSAAESADARVPYDELKRRILQGSMEKKRKRAPLMKYLSAAAVFVALIGAGAAFALRSGAGTEPRGINYNPSDGKTPGGAAVATHQGTAVTPNAPNPSGQQGAYKVTEDMIDSSPIYRYLTKGGGGSVPEEVKTELKQASVKVVDNCTLLEEGGLIPAGLPADWSRSYNAEDGNAYAKGDGGYYFAQMMEECPFTLTVGSAMVTDARDDGVYWVCWRVGSNLYVYIECTGVDQAELIAMLTQSAAAQPLKNGDS